MSVATKYEQKGRSVRRVRCSTVYVRHHLRYHVRRYVRRIARRTVRRTKLSLNGHNQTYDLVMYAARVLA
jgi:hypothetical protein